MSERPATHEMLIAELHGWKWDSNYSTLDEVVPVIEEVLDERDGLESFCEWAFRAHADTLDGHFGPESWRDFRNFTVRKRYEQKFDYERIFYEIEGRIRASKYGK